MRHMVAGCGFVLALFLPFWWAISSTPPGEDAWALPFALTAYAGLAVAALAMYYALFRASGPAMLLLALLLGVIAMSRCFRWIDGTSSLEAGALAAAILVHHLILKILGAMSPARPI